MDDEAALIARRVATAATAWFNAPADVDAYRRLANAVGEWTAYCQPHLDDPDGEELLDDLGADSPPVPIAEGLDELDARLRAQLRQRVR